LILWKYLDTVIYMHKLLVLLFCSFFALQGMANAQARQFFCPLAQGQADAVSSVVPHAQMDQHSMNCCNDTDTAAHTKNSCKTVTPCTSAGCAYLTGSLPIVSSPWQSLDFLPPPQIIVSSRDASVALRPPKIG